MPAASVAAAAQRAGPARHRLPGRPLEEPSNRFPREMIIPPLQASGGQNPAYRPASVFSLPSKSGFFSSNTVGTFCVSMNCTSFDMQSLFIVVRCS